MSGILTESMARALAGGKPRVILVAIQHPSGAAYFHTGLGPLLWNGNKWTGAGKLGTLSPVQQTSDISVQDITFQLSGVDADIVAQLDDDVRNLNGSAWLACLGDDGKVIANPYQIVDAELDYQTFQIQDDGTATISIIAHAGFYTLDRGVDEAWTPQNQKLTYPTDAGLDMIPGLQNQSLLWTPS